MSRKICGIDETHYGSVFGPVYAAAVIIPEKIHTALARSGVRDSKEILKESERRRLAKLIQDSCPYAIGFCTAAEMRKMGWAVATYEAMRRALLGLKEQPDFVEVDGKYLIPGYPAERQRAVVGGDRLVLEISAASIIAKVAADEAVLEMADKYPMYDLHKNKGYLSPAHQRGIDEHGLCVEHRRFRGVIA